jgi:hypothetical protein
MGELAQMAGRPTLVDAYAKESVEALIIPPDRLRDGHLSVSILEFPRMSVSFRSPRDI